MDDGCNVSFSDLEGDAQFDLLFHRGSFIGEVECKSLSADAGRQIHRKDFYRFIETITPALTAHQTLRRREVLLVTLDGRLSPTTADQAALVASARALLRPDAPAKHRTKTFSIERHAYEPLLGSAPLNDQKAFYKACGAAFGQNTHVAGGLTEDGGCIVVMRSLREDDTSKPMLDAMRKAAEQFSKQRPAFIAIQEHGIEAADLMLPHVRRQVGILSYALFEHYGAHHVNATHVTGFGAVVMRDGMFVTPAFTIGSPAPKFPASANDAPTFLGSLTDQDYAAALGAPLPAESISDLPLDVADFPTGSDPDDAPNVSS